MNIKKAFFLYQLTAGLLLVLGYLFKATEGLQLYFLIAQISVVPWLLGDLVLAYYVDKAEEQKRAKQ